MIKIELQSPLGLLSLSVDEATALMDNLAKKLKHARRVDDPLQTFAVNDGYIDRNGFYDFFRPFISDKALRNRAGKLYAAIMRSVLINGRNPEPLQLVVVCDKCRYLADRKCQLLLSSSYYRSDLNYFISIDSIKEAERHFLPGGDRQLSGKKLEDFRLLIENL